MDFTNILKFAEWLNEIELWRHIHKETITCTPPCSHSLQYVRFCISIKFAFRLTTTRRNDRCRCYNFQMNMFALACSSPQIYMFPVICLWRASHSFTSNTVIYWFGIVISNGQRIFAFPKCLARLFFLLSVSLSISLTFAWHKLSAPVQKTARFVWNFFIAGSAQSRLHAEKPP